MARTREQLREYHREWSKRNRDRIREQSRDAEARRKLSGTPRKRSPAAIAANLVRCRAYFAANRDRCLAMRKEYRLRAEYGISLADRAAMVAAQNGVCAICGQPPSGSGDAAILHIDHDHDTNALRGMLCFACNAAIGMFRSDAAICRAAAGYLDKHGARPNPRIAPNRSGGAKPSNDTPLFGMEVAGG